MKTNIPYGAQIKIVEKMINEVPSLGSEGLDLQTFYNNISEGKNQNRSFSLTFVKFLGLIDSNKAKVWSTDLGKKFAHVSSSDRKKFLVKHFPQLYKTILKWIYYGNGKEMSLSELRTKYVETYGGDIAPALLNGAITSFLNYANMLGVIKYIAQGSMSKAVLTELGKNYFDNQSEEQEPEKKEIKEESEEKKEKPKGYHVNLSASDRYPVTIEIHTDADWDVLESIIKAYRQAWKEKK